MCVESNSQTCSCNHCCSGKAISITYSESLCSLMAHVHAMHMCHIVMLPAKLYNIFPHYLINGKISGEKKKLLKIKCVF